MDKTAYSTKYGFGIIRKTQPEDNNVHAYLFYSDKGYVFFDSVNDWHVAGTLFFVTPITDNNL